MATTAIDPSQSLINVLGLQDLPEAEREKIIDQATDLVQKRVMLRLIDMLSTEEAQEASKLADSPEELLKFLSAKVPSLPDLMYEEAIAVRDGMLEAGKQGLE